MKLTLLLAALTLLPGPTLLAQDTIQVTGLSAAYFGNGEIVELVTAGYADAETRRPVTDTTVFSAASLTKPVIAYLVWELVDAGRLELDRPVAQDYRYLDIQDDSTAATVTLRQLLTHQSGLPNWRDGDSLSFKQDPGQGFSYSGEGYVWLGKMLEAITGRPLEELAQMRVFEPLGMRHSSLVFLDRFAGDYAVPYEKGEPVTHDHKWSSVNAAASMQTTAGDYARFLIALMERTDYLDQVKPVETAMWNNSPTPAPNTVGWAPGLGWQRSSRGDQFWHWGHNPGFRAYFTILPAEQRGLVFFTNNSDGLDRVPTLTKKYDLGDQPGWRWAGYE